MDSTPENYAPSRLLLGVVVAAAVVSALPFLPALAAQGTVKFKGLDGAEKNRFSTESTGGFNIAALEVADTDLSTTQTTPAIAPPPRSSASTPAPTPPGSS